MACSSEYCFQYDSETESYIVLKKFCIRLEDRPRAVFWKKFRIFKTEREMFETMSCICAKPVKYNSDVIPDEIEYF